MLLFIRAKLPLNRPIGESQKKGNNDVRNWHKHQKTKCPTESGFWEYLAESHNLYNSHNQREEYDEDRENPHENCGSGLWLILHFVSFQLVFEVKF